MTRQSKIRILKLPAQQSVAKDLKLQTRTVANVEKVARRKINQVLACPELHVRIVSGCRPFSWPVYEVREGVWFELRKQFREE